MTHPAPDYTIGKRFTFAASHRLPGMPEGHKCRNLHGHTYTVEVDITGDVDVLGMIIDYHDLGFMQDKVKAQFDHKHLNDVMGLVPPTAENLAAWIHREISALAHPKMGKVTRVRVSEGPDTWAEYRP